MRPGRSWRSSMGESAMTRRSTQPGGFLRGRDYSGGMDAVAVPRLETERLLLRGWEERDLDAHAAMSADPEVQRFLQGVLDRTQSWREMAFHVGPWALRGYGNWVVERRSDGAFLGRAGLWNPEGW